MKLKETIIALSMSSLALTGIADTVLIDDDFASSTITSSSRIYLTHAGDGSGDDWVKGHNSDWTITDGAFGSAATTIDSNTSEGGIGQLYTVASTDTSLTKVHISFDYTVGGGSTLYFFANGLTTNGTPDANESLYNTMATGANIQDIADSNFADVSLLTRTDPASGTSDAIAFPGGAIGVSGTYNRTVDLSDLSWSADEAPGLSGSLTNLTDLDYIAFMFGNDVTVTDGTGAVSIDNFKVTALPQPVRNTFMVFGNPYVDFPDLEIASILESINKEVEDAGIDFVIIVGELTRNADVDEFEAVKYIMDYSPVPVYVSGSNHDLVGNYWTGDHDDYARFESILGVRAEYAISKGRSHFIFQSHGEGVGSDFTNAELARLEEDTSYDFVYQIAEKPHFDGIDRSVKPFIGITGGTSQPADCITISDRHPRLTPREHKDNEEEDDYFIVKENDGHILLDSYVDRILDYSWNITVDRAENIGTVEIAPILTVAPEGIQMTLVAPTFHVSNTVDLSYASVAAIDISISIVDESHDGAFSVLSVTPQTLTANTTLEFNFDNTVANLGGGETATGLVVVAWNAVDSLVISETVLPIRATYGAPAADNTFLGAVSENWENPLNWDLNRVPGLISGDPAFIENALTATVTTQHMGDFPWSAVVRGDAILNIGADLLGLSSLKLGSDAGQVGTVNQTAGAVALDLLEVGESAGTAAVPSVYTLSGGTLALIASPTLYGTGVLDVNGGAFTIDQGPANLTMYGEGVIKVQSGSFKSLGTGNSDVLTIQNDVEISGGTFTLQGQNKFSGVLAVKGDAASISIRSFNNPTSGSPEILFEMSEYGISPIVCPTWANISTYMVTVDGTDYIGGAASFPLIESGQVHQEDRYATVVVTNFAEGLRAEVIQDADGMTLFVTVDNFQKWMGTYGLTGAAAAADYDFDGDTLNNFYEYAFGGDPTAIESVAFPIAGDLIEDGGTHYLKYVYPRRIGSEQFIEYRPLFGTDLVTTNWDGSMVESVGLPVALDDDYEAVTIRVDITDEPIGFIHVNVSRK